MALTYLGATQIVPNYNVAGIAKAALESIVRYLAFDLGERGIRVNAISAGPISTASSRQVAGFSAMPKKVAAASPLKRGISADDIGNCAVYLASDLSIASHGRRALRRRRLPRDGDVPGRSAGLMDEPSADELAAIVAAYAVLQRRAVTEPTPTSPWRRAARALDALGAERTPWRKATRPA